jgi:hypothetical protein
MPTYEIVLATRDLAVQMAPHLRAADRDEVWAARHWAAEEALLRSLEVTPDAKAWLVDGEPIAIWGVEPINAVAGIGLAWLLGAEAINEHKLRFWQLCKLEVARQVCLWRVLLNWIDWRYEPSLRWAIHLGFVLDEPKPFGVDGALFCCAAMVR